LSTGNPYPNLFGFSSYKPPNFPYAIFDGFIYAKAFTLAPKQFKQSNCALAMAGT
jgi:hypothetical protein